MYSVRTQISSACDNYNSCYNSSIHLQDAKGDVVDLSTYEGKVLLIINVASKWYP